MIMELLDNDAMPKTGAPVQNLTDNDSASKSVETPATEFEITDQNPAGASEAQSVEQLIERLKTMTDNADTDGIDADEVARLKQQFYSMHNESLYMQRQAFIEAGNQPEAFVPAPNPFEEQFKTLLNEIKEKKAVIRARIEAEQQKNLERKNAIIAELNEMSADTDNVNKHYPRAKELQTEFKELGEVPQHNATDVWKAFQDAVEFFYDQWKVNKELRDYDFKKDLSEKQLLIDEAVKLADEEDVVLAFKRLQELHDKWRQIGPVDKEHRETIWNTFKDASATVNKRYQAFFEERKAREQANEAAKTALCERIEAIDTASLAGYSGWNKATKEIIQAQEEWKTLGFASRKTNNLLFSRFRKCCDEFFAAKAAFFHNVKDEMTRNLEAKTALCEQAEALMDSTDWKSTTDRLVDLQKQWKKIGAVQKKYSDQIWTRFLAACDHFFEQKKRATSDTRKTEHANLAAKRQIVETLTALNSPDADTPREQAIARIHELRASWQATGHVPFKEKDKLHEAYREVVRQLFDKYDINENRARQESFAKAVDEMASDRGRISRERERLMRAYENRRNELHTYENNLGFFNSKTKSGDSMLRDIQGKMQRIKNDIADLEKKIELLDSKL